MPKNFFAIILCWIGACAIAVGQEKNAGKSLLKEAEKAWAAALELDDKLIAKAAEEAEEEEDEKKKPEETEKGNTKSVPDFSGAFALFKKAYEAGSSKSALRISDLLLVGRGIPKDTIGAFEWAEKAADMGDVEALLLTASKYEEGRGTTKSMPKALGLYEKALERRSPLARMKVAELLDAGEDGIEQDRERALPLFQEAAKAGDAGAIYMVGLYVQRGYVVAKDDAAASQWFLRAGELGEPRAQRKLAMRYFRGMGVEEDVVEALMWTGLAIKNPDGDVETKNLAREYSDAMKGNVTPRKAEQANRKVERFKLKTFKDISLPALPYNGPALIYHTLTDVGGKKLEAAVIGMKGDSVLLERRGDGKRFTVPLERMSDESKKLLEKISKKE